MSIKSKNRIYQLDLFRFFAALIVVLYHYFFRGYAADNLSDLDFSEISDYFKYGFLGINIFFIISGFVISLSIKDRSLIKFIISRLSRLYPIYWICVLITFVVILLFGAPRFTAELEQFILNLSMFHNYVRVESIDGVYWTLFIEMKFYIFIIGSYLVLNKFKPIKLDYLIYTWLTLSVLYLYFSELPIFRIGNSLFILDWSSYFIAGMILYQIYKSKLNVKYAVLLSIALFTSIQHTITETAKKANHFNIEFSPIIACGIIVIFYLLILLVACHKLRGMNSSKFIKIGMLTYPLYLIHQKVGYIIFNNVGTDTNKYSVAISTIFLMIAISFILSEFYEPKASNYLKVKLKYLTTKYLK
ncbi:acyltransferase family protein [Winogradskyella costae]|uniref:acyltransferase family protein n=1 Tax=Winogradskyella costae TaxID=2697008 RepID=UPI0015CBF6D1|nr:acyltransferase [Winogradskyella costae]